MEKKDQIRNLSTYQEPPNKVSFAFPAKALLEHLPTPDNATIIKIYFFRNQKWIMIDVMIDDEST